MWPVVSLSVFEGGASPLTRLVTALHGHQDFVSSTFDGGSA